METFGIIILVSLGVFLLSMITLVTLILIKLGDRKNVHGVIFLKSGSQKKLKFLRNKEREKKLDGESYIFDEKAVVKTPYKDFIYFMEGNPKPLVFDFKSNKPEIVSQDLKQILDSDLVQKLFSDEDMRLLKLLAIINLVMAFIIICMVGYSMFQGATIKQSEENYAYLYNITRNAIIGA